MCYIFLCGFKESPRSFLRIRLLCWVNQISTGCWKVQWLWNENRGKIPALTCGSCMNLLLFIHYVVSNSLQPRGLQRARLPCPSPTPGAWSNSCPLSWWCHPTISSSVVPLSSCLQFFPASGSFPRNWLFASGGQSIGASASASFLPMNIQDWFPLGLTGLISLQFKGPSRVFFNTTIQKHQFFGTQ